MSDQEPAGSTSGGNLRMETRTSFVVMAAMAIGVVLTAVHVAASWL